MSVSSERAAERIEGFLAWARANAPLGNAWHMTRAEARLLADRLEAAERERDEADQAHAHWLNAAVELETRAEAAEARVERLEAALRGLDAPIAWITDFYPKAMVQMPGEHFAKIRAARSVLLHPEEEEKPK